MLPAALPASRVNAYPESYGRVVLRASPPRQASSVLSQSKSSLGDRRLVPRSPPEGLGWGQGGTAGCLHSCSEREQGPSFEEPLAFHAACD